MGEFAKLYTLILSCLGSCLLATSSFGQSDFSIQKREEKAIIDGKSDDAVWNAIPAFSGFTQNAPNPGEEPLMPTHIKMYYSNEGIYILADMEDTEPQKILRQLSGRDAIENTDHFQVAIDPFKGGVNGIVFGVTASGVQIDKRIENGAEDLSWNAIWYSAVDIHERGWTVEMYIPFFSFRFPDGKEQSWNINFFRQIRRIREESSWSFIDPAISGWLNQFNTISGIRDIESPVRLQLTPYLSGYYRHSSFSGGEAVNDYTVNGGLDLKLGLSDAFTLDMTLVPDFGQVQSDNNVLNLSPFEIQFEEFRPFFQEGTQLFRKGGLFYSRRVGGRPDGFYDVLGKGDSLNVIENPDKARLLNATKVTGRTTSGLGIGVFNAVEGSTYAKYEDESGKLVTQETAVPTNYNILVFDQNLSNNGYLTLTNANTMRRGGATDANVTSLDFRVADAENRFSNSSLVRVSQRFTQDGIERGFNYFTSFNKGGGNWRYGVSHGIESDTYNPNDLGILFANNEIFNGANLNYNSFVPKGAFNFWGLGVNSQYGLLYKPSEFTNWNLNANGYAVLKSFHGFGFNVNSQLIEGKDFFETRKSGVAYTTPVNAGYNVWISTDYRRAFAFDWSFGQQYYKDIDQRDIFIRFSPRFRFSDKLSSIYVISRGLNYDQQGFASFNEGDSSVFGWRDNHFLTNVWTVNYIFNANSSLSFRLRHHWQSVEYNRFLDLNEESGDLVENTDYLEMDGFGEELNRNFNSFSVDLVYRWIFSPGSELNLVYKYNLDDDRNQLIRSYRENLTEVGADPDSKIGSISFRFVYFMDAGKLLRRS